MAPGEQTQAQKAFGRPTSDSPNQSNETGQVYPDQYLHVEECRSGETWIMPISDRTKLDIKALVKRWIKQEYCGELRLDGDLMPRLQGDYYAQIKLDCNPPDSVSCWTSGGFYLKTSD